MWKVANIFLLLGACALGQAGLVDQYHLAGTITVPIGANGGTHVFDVLADGRLIVVVGLDVHVEVAPGSGAFFMQGTLPGPPVQFPAFVKVSPGGTTLAFGDNFGQIGLFDVATLAGSFHSVDHADATWLDANRLVVVAFGSVSVFDVTNLTNTVIINNVGGASGGIAFDAAQNLLTGNGFEIAGPSTTGDIKSFSSAAWMNALATGTPLDFEAQGTFLGNVLSATSLGFDARGNLHVGGGDLFGPGSADFASVLSRSAVAAALTGAAPLNQADPVRSLSLDPDSTNNANFYTVLVDPINGRLFVDDTSDSTIYVFAASVHPGSGEDFVLETGLNGPASASADVKTAAHGDLLNIHMESRLGLLDNSVPVLVAQLFATGQTPNPVFGFPEVQVNPSVQAPFGVVVVLDGNAWPLFQPLVLPAGGLSFTAVVPFIQGGLSVMLQAFALSSSAANGIFAATNGHELVF